MTKTNKQKVKGRIAEKIGNFLISTGSRIKSGMTTGLRALTLSPSPARGRGRALFFLVVFCANLIGSTAAVIKTETARAADTSAFNVFGEFGQAFEQFDTKANASQEKQLNKNQTSWDLVAILVSEDIADSKAIYDGLQSQHNPGVLQEMINDATQSYRLLSSGTLIDRIERYAKDVQGISEGASGKMYTKTLLVKVKNNEDTETIRSTLEKLYLSGDGTEGENNSLKGIVLIGDIPLPVVNKGGNHFISIFPYTDFSDSYYIFDQASGEFIVNPKVQKPGAEVWHGVIKPPVNGEEGSKLLAEYFDKNHLFKIKEKGYGDFNKKIFFLDLADELALMSREGFDKYLTYLKYWEDISYARYNKHWAASLQENDLTLQPDGDKIDNDSDGKIDEDPINGYDDDLDGETGSPLFGLSDRKDNDGDGEIDNPEEGVWGLCSTPPPTGPVAMENCLEPGKEFKTNNYYNTKAGSKYFVTDGVDNNNDGLIDEKIDEDPGDAVLNIDNDHDGRIDEDSSTDNDADGDKKVDEDGLGDMNGDGCPGECDFDEDNDSLDSDSDGFPDGYERDYGSLTISVDTLPDLIDVVGSIGGSKEEMIAALEEAFDAAPSDFKENSDPSALYLEVPILDLPIPLPRIFPWPDPEDWIDEESVNDDDEDGKVDEDTVTANDNDQDGSTDEDPGDPLEAVKAEGLDQLPDIRTAPVIEAFLKKYSGLFDKFFAQTNAWVNGTGRWEVGGLDADGNTISDLDTIPGNIAKKDEFVRIYLRAVNDAAERRVDRYAEKLQEDINLIKGSKISGYALLDDNNGVFQPGQQIVINPVSFINFGYINQSFYAEVDAVLDQIEAIINDPALIAAAQKDLLKKVQGPVSDTTPVYINGISFDKINSIQDCTLYRGSKDRENSQTVIANTVYDPTSSLVPAPMPMPPKEWTLLPSETLSGNDNNEYKGLMWLWSNADIPGVYNRYAWNQENLSLNKPFAGCFAQNIEHPERCFPFMAFRYIFSYGGMREVDNVPANATTHQACFDLKDKNGFDDYSLKVYDYLRKLGNAGSEEQKVALDSIYPQPGTAYRAPKEIKLLDFATEPPIEFEIAPGSVMPIDPAVLANIPNTALKDFSVNFEDVLKNYLGGDRVDNNADNTVDEADEATISFFDLDSNGQPNWFQVGEQMLQSVRTDENAAEGKDKPYKFVNLIPGVKELVLRIEPIAGKPIKSIVYHKEPSGETMTGQLYQLARDANGEFILNPPADWATKGMFQKEILTDSQGNSGPKSTGFAQSLPIDSPRFVSFRDINGNYQKIVYPNIYTTKSLAEFKQQLIDVETQLKAIPANPAYVGPYSSLSIDKYLQDILFTQDVSPGGLGESFDAVYTTKVDDAIQWKEMDIDTKHDYVMRRYLGSADTPYTKQFETEDGYEYLYLTSEGTSESLFSQFNKNNPDPKLETRVSPIDCSQDNAKALPICIEEAPPAGTPEETGKKGEEDDSMLPVFIFEWFQKLQEWADETESLISKGSMTQACPAGGFADLADDPGYGLPPEEVPLGPPTDDNNDGIPDAAAETVDLAIQLEIPEKYVLKSGQNDQTAIIVFAMTGSGEVNTADDYSEVELKFENTPAGTEILKNINGDKQTMSNGIAKFTVASTDQSGASLVKAFLSAKPTVTSDALKIVTSPRTVRISSFNRFTTYIPIKEGELGFSVSDSQGKIAEIDSKSGRITILSNAYEVRALASAADKPARQGIFKKSDPAGSEAVAIVFFVVDDKNPAQFVPTQFDFVKSASGLTGVQIKDSDPSDEYGFQTISDSLPLTGELAITQNMADDSLKTVGTVIRNGQIFLDDSLRLEISKGAKTDPVVWILKNNEGKKIAEFFLGSKFELVTNLPKGGYEKLFSKIWNNANWMIGMTRPLTPALSPRHSGAGQRERERRGMVALLKIAHAAEAMTDTDADGLNDLEEIIIGTSYKTADSNEDGISDFDSLTQGINPIVKEKKALFSDLQPGDRGYKEVLKIFKRGIFVTDEKDQVRPNANLTRQEFVKLDLGSICVLCDNFHSSIKKSIFSLYSLSPFPDTNIGENYKYCIAEGKNRGIISGYGALENKGYFIPEGNISRAEATKVILETARQQIDTLPVFTSETLKDKPWFYNYVLTSQKERFYPKGIWIQIDILAPEVFQKYFDSEIAKINAGEDSKFIDWLQAPISKVEFAIMVARFTDKYNCLNQDKDKEGLPDNFEKYLYSTKSENPDSDLGGINDFEEVIRGTDPNDPEDDFPKPKATDDNDKDWLTNGEEEILGTNPDDPDTDKGGVKDGVEVLLQKTDPLNGVDDKPRLNFAEGAYTIGKNVEPTEVYLTPDPATLGDAVINTQDNDSIPADGISELYVGATIYDDDDKIDKADNSSVIKFAFKNPEDYANATFTAVKVQVKEGYAETKIISKIKAGLPIVIASVEGKDIPTEEKLIDVHALEPAKMEMSADNQILPAGGLSTTNVHLRLFDKNNNPANNGTYQLNFKLESDASGDATEGKKAIFDPKLDEDKGAEGLQLSSTVGEYDFKLTSGKLPEKIKVLASYQGEAESVPINAANLINEILGVQQQTFVPQEVTGQLNLQSRNDLKITTTLSKNTLKNNGQDELEINIGIKDSLGQIMATFNGNASVMVSNPAIAQIISGGAVVVGNKVTVSILAGEGKVKLRSTKKAGEFQVDIGVDGFDSTTVSSENAAYLPAKMILNKIGDNWLADSNQVYEVRGKLFDFNDNLVKNATGITATFSIDPETATIANVYGLQTAQFKDGEVSFFVSPTGKTGNLRLRVKAPNIIDGYIEVNLHRQFIGQDFKTIKPKVLAASFLGSDYGNVFKENYLAGWFVFSGKTESAVSLITDPKPKMRMAEVQPSGDISISESGSIAASAWPANKETGKVNRVVLTDLNTQKDLAEIFLKMKPQSEVILEDSEADITEGKDYVRLENLVTDQEEYQFKIENKTGYVSRDGNILAKIMPGGEIVILAAAAGLTAEENANRMSFVLTDNGLDIGKIGMIIANPESVSITNQKLDLATLPSGVYIRSFDADPDKQIVDTVTGRSSQAPHGSALVDLTQKMPDSMAPGLNYLSLEKVGDAKGVGFTGDNKHVLLFASGNTFGEANLPASSDAGIVLGDPTIRLDNRFDQDKSPGLLYGSTGYTKDVGKLIYNDNAKIKDITSIDYDNDGDQDVLPSFENGDIRLLENKNQGQRMEDRGVLLKFPNGLNSVTNLDLNDDGWEDLVVATQDSCVKGEVCVNAYLNDDGNFVRSNLKLEGLTTSNRISQIRSVDLNGDGYKDLVAANDAGIISAYLVKNGVLNRKEILVGSLASSVNQQKNLIAETYVYYDGMEGNQPDTPDDQYFDVLNLEKETEFKSISIDDNLKVSSTKIATDNTDPKNSIANDDIISYTLKLTNSSSSTTLKNLAVADLITGYLAVSEEDIKCSDCKSPIKVAESGQSLRPYLVTGIDLAPKQTVTITYSGTISDLPKIKFTFAKAKENFIPVKDEFPDILATPEQNGTGKIVYFYSTGVSADGTPSYAQYVTAGNDPAAAQKFQRPKDPKTSEPLGLDYEKVFQDLNDDGVPRAFEYMANFGEFPPGVYNAGGNAPDSEPLDDTISNLPGGIGEAYQAVGQALDDTANAIEDGMAALTCAGGCIPTPINFAFLAIGAINVMGIPVGWDPGTPIFGWGVPFTGVCAGQACYSSLGGRIYLSPTLTAKLAMAVCIGPYGVGMCKPIVIPLPDFGGLCAAISGAIEGALADVNAAITDLNEGVAALSGDGSMSDTPTASGNNYTGGFQASSSMGNYGFKADATANIRIPGFPSVITDWFDKQIAEIINKLTDLPDIYIQYPDIVGLARETGTAASNFATSIKNLVTGKNTLPGQPINPKGIRNVLVELNKIPFIQIQPQEVLIKIPAITPAEIERFINDAKQWIKDEKAELDRVLNIWKCGPFKEMVNDPSGALEADGSPKQVPGYTDEDGNIVYGERSYKTICDTILVDFGAMISSVEKNIEIIEGYKELPRQLLTWRTMLTKYVIQVICYIDAIINFFIGNVAKWLDQIMAWVDTVLKIYEIINTWKPLIELIIDYEVSCDNCTSARFTLLDLVLKLFLFIPSPPIIPIPKLPDIYVDLSHIQAGIKILWPDIEFRPERIVLPKLPRILLPDLPTLTIVLPEIPLLPDLSLNLPELPDLPPLSLPVLPNLPPPPKIPDFPVEIKLVIDILKKVFKILCLIQKALIPVPEFVLKSEIEHMTERGLSPLLPIDLGLSFQFPEINYDFVRRVVLTTQINLKFDFDNIYTFVQDIADTWNSLAGNLVNKLNELIKKAEEEAAAAAAAANEAMQNAMPEDVTVGGGQVSYDQERKQIELLLRQTAPELMGASDMMRDLTKRLELAKVRNEELIARDFQDIKLVAGNQTLDAKQLSAGKTLDNLAMTDLSQQVASLGGEFAETRKLASLRSSLVAYGKQNQSIDSVLMRGNLKEFAIAAANLPNLRSAIENSGVSINNQGNKLYAKVPSLDDIVKNSGLGDMPVNKPVVKGVFIYNKDKNQNEKVMKYEDELSLATTLYFIDVNNDSDLELLVSFGGNLYLKENFTATGSMGKIYGGSPKYYNLNDLAPKYGGAKGFKVESNSVGNSELSWLASPIKNLGGYELMIEKRFPASMNEMEFKAEYRKVYLIEAPEQEEQSELPIFKYGLFVKEVNGEIKFSGSEQKVLGQGEQYQTSGETEFLASSDSTLKIEVGASIQQASLLSGQLIKVGTGRKVTLENGRVVAVNSAISKEQQLQTGFKIELDQKYLAGKGAEALINFGKEGYLNLRENQELEISLLDDPEEPKASLKQDNGFYFGSMRYFDQTGFRSNWTEATTISPNICSDKGSPFAVGGPADREVSIYKTLELDAAKSIDGEGKVTTFYVDTDLESDTDNDGNMTNDKNLGRDLNISIDSDGDGIPNNDLDNSLMILGPYKTPGDRKVMLNVEDQSGNSGQQEITIKVFVPAVNLDDSSANPGNVSGWIDPAISEIPIGLVRNREELFTFLKTKKATSQGKYPTDGEGKFLIDDLNLKDTVVIKDKNGNVIAEIDPKTGHIILKNPLYKLEVLPAEDPILPTRIEILDLNDNLIATLFIVADANTDVTIEDSQFVFNKESVKDLKGVHIKLTDNLEGNLSVSLIPGNSEKYPGGAEIVDKTSLKRIAVIDSGGNYYIYDPRLTLKLQAATDLSEPLIIDYVWTENGSSKLLGEFFTAFNNQKGITILSAEQFKLFTGEGVSHGPNFDGDKDGMADLWEYQYKLNPQNKGDAIEDADQDGLTNLEEFRAGTNPLLADSDQDGYSDSFELSSGKNPNQKAVSPFLDVDETNQYYQNILNFYQRGILDGIPAGNGQIFGFATPIPRAEFAKVMLDTFCIVPRPEAYEAPSVFTDITYDPKNMPWYFAPVKEAYFQGFVTGYLGYVDKVSGRSPFVPDAGINRAEAVKVIMEALQSEGLIDLNKIPKSEIWYESYLQAAQNLEAIIKKENILESNFIITAAEAALPTETLSRGEFIKLADRVLSAYDCSTIDSDGDGMPDFWEDKNKFNKYFPPDAGYDPDKDGLLNLDEYKFGTDPHNPDTDGGGIKDGKEVLERHTNPLDLKDDYLDSDNDGLSDNDEKRLGTDPFDPDTDDGGVKDGDEVFIYGTDPLNPADDMDSDLDGLSDFDEINKYKTDPLNPDTDGGGIKDGAEVYRGTDPLEPKDDKIDPRQNLGEGLYLIQNTCTACPCDSAIDHTADLIPGDKIRGVISSEDDLTIFSESEEMEIETTVE